MLSYKLNPKPTEEETRIEEVLDGNERIAHILQQPFPSTDPKGRIADEDYEALHKAMQRAAPRGGREGR